MFCNELMSIWGLSLFFFFYESQVIQMNIQEEIRKQIVQELKINQASSQCPHVVVCYHSFYHNGAFSLVLEYMDRGSLADVIRQVKTILEPYLAVVCKQVQLKRPILHQMVSSILMIYQSLLIFPLL